MGKIIKLTEDDYKKLVHIISVYKKSNRLKSKNLRQLAEELGNAQVVDDCESLTDVVRINSTVIFKNIKTGKTEMVTVVFPSQTSQDGSRISILSPLGTALIGEKEKNITVCYAPEDKIELKIEKIISHNSVLTF